MAVTTATPQAVTVLGAGSWGTALACLMARNGLRITLWDHDARQITALEHDRVNARYLPGISLPDNIRLCQTLEQALAATPDVLMVVPSHAFRAVLQRAAPFLNADTGLAWATKGLEPVSCKLLHEVLAEELAGTHRTAVISGPTFAREVAAGLPTAITVASADAAYADRWASFLHSNSFRAYTSGDIAGVELGGAIKNVLAIATGIADGLGFGANTRAALITRGLAEMMRIGIALGGRRETFMGLAGLGDLILTSTDDQSRNRRLGLALGRGHSLESARAAIDQVIEGVQTAREIHTLARRHAIDMPITEQVYRVLYEGCAPRDAVQALLGRDPKAETP